jgi:hypothetical protein
MRGFLLVLRVITASSMALVMAEKAIAIAKRVVQYVVRLFTVKKQPVSKFRVYGA